MELKFFTYKAKRQLKGFLSLWRTNKKIRTLTLKGDLNAV
nr:MAG TPA: hypothetical protein [Caudoviricetes sp.]